MSRKTASSPSPLDPYKLYMIVANPDGTLERNLKFRTVAATPDPSGNVAVLSKDVNINQANKTWARIFLPRQALDSSSSSCNKRGKLPVIFYFQGGGFIYAGAATTVYHGFCSEMAIQLPAVVVSVEYRLAPEHRLPAAYDDAIEVLYWIRTTEEDWVKNYADLSCCFLAGSCAGGNIAYHAGLRAAAQVDNMLPLKIRGLILHQPPFGGVKRTESELRKVYDRYLSISCSDVLWGFALPMGADRDHEYSNPTVGGGSKLLDKIRVLGCKVMMTGYHGDALIDRQIELVKMLEQKGVEVVSHFGKGGYHGVDFKDPVKRHALLANIKNFVLSSTVATSNYNGGNKLKDISLHEREQTAYLPKLQAKI